MASGRARILSDVRRHNVGGYGVEPIEVTACADLARETAEELEVEGAYRKGQDVIRRLLGLESSMPSIQETVVDDASAVGACSVKQRPPLPLGGTVPGPHSATRRSRPPLGTRRSGSAGLTDYRL